MTNCAINKLDLIIVLAVVFGLSSCRTADTGKVNYRPLSIYESCDGATEPDMQIKMKDMTVLDGSSEVCLKKYPLAHNVPIDSIQLIYDKKINIYSLRFFPVHSKAGSLFYAINSKVGKFPDLNLVAGNKVIAHPAVTGAQIRGFFDLGGFNKNEADRLMATLVLKDETGEK